ncbi:MAG: agmatinase [Anaerolineae bacterium]
MGRYQPVDALQSPRFSGVRTFMRLPHVQSTEDVDFAIMGLPFDTGATFKVGARFGPEGIRSASALLRPYHPELDVMIFEYLSGVDYGDAPVAPGFIEDSLERMATFLTPLHGAGVVPFCLGGDHSVLLAELRAAAGQHGPLALVQFDSHSDTWDAYFGHKYTHGTPVRRAVEEDLLDPARSIQVGMRGSLYSPQDLDEARGLGFEVVPMSELRRRGVEEVVAQIQDRVGMHPAFLSFDVDFVDPAFAPGTGTPEVGGPTSGDALSLLRGLTGIPFVAGDVVEVIPQYDPAQVTAYLAANVAYEFVALLAWDRKHGSN